MIGDCTWDELDTRMSRVPSIAPDAVPDRVRRRRQRLRRLRDEAAAEAHG
jgi:hypothetical protein